MVNILCLLLTAFIQMVDSEMTHRRFMSLEIANYMDL